jgi:hypothetical protein
MTTIQPLSNRPREISVTEIIEPAYERVKLVLFRPFDFTKWIIIGFCAWLAELGESGGGGGANFGNHSFNTNNGQSAEQFREYYHKTSDFVLANLGWIIPAAIAAILIGIAIWVCILWLSSRGKFMFLHCVALNKAEVDMPWHKYAQVANSLFWFRLVLGLMAMFLILAPMVFIAISIFQMVSRGEPDFAGIVISVVLGLVVVFFAIVFALIHKFMVDMVVPIMYLRGSTCMAAWREFWGLLTTYPGQFVLYILFQIVIAMAIGAMLVTAILVTCCIAACFLALPFVGTVLLLPVLVFKRAYSLYFLAQFGPQYDVFPASPAPPAQMPVSPLGMPSA